MSLDGTRTSHRWAEKPGSFDVLNLRAVFEAANEFGIPELPAAIHQPSRLVSYADRRACDSPRDGDAVHTFLDDYRFEVMWNRPERPLSRLRRVGTALAPDFSLWPGMPPAMQAWQVYRSRWCGAWWLSQGIGVIPTVSWSDERSYPFAFAGIARGSVVALSAVGVMRDRGALWRFGEGYAAMLAAAQPAAVLCYGPWPPLLERHVPVTAYPTRWER